MIFSPFERMIAFRYLRARREEGFVSVIAGFSLAGIALGVATLIIVMAVMSGFPDELMRRILGLNGHLEVYGTSNAPLRDFDSLVNRIQKIRGVMTVIPNIQGQVMATGTREASGAIVRGVRQSDLRRRPIIAGNIKKGTLDDFKGRNTVAVGARLAERFGLEPGGRLKLISPHRTPTAFGPMLRSKTYRVVATFEVGMFEYDDSYIFMPLEAAQLFFRTGDTVTSLEMMVEDPDEAGEIVREIRKIAGPVRIRDWKMSQQGFLDALEVERNVMFLILTLIIVVAAFNVISGMIMLVKDKGRDIAILRTMGATRGMVMRIFLLAGASIGIVGTAAGFALGIAFAKNIETIRQWLQSVTDWSIFPAQVYYLTRMPAKIETWDVASVIVVALALSLLATLYPAWRASRLEPVEALRYE